VVVTPWRLIEEAGLRLDEHIFPDLIVAVSSLRCPFHPVLLSL
jgi:hypothetical protein